MQMILHDQAKQDLVAVRMIALDRSFPGLLTLQKQSVWLSSSSRDEPLEVGQKGIISTTRHASESPSQ